MKYKVGDMLLFLHERDSGDDAVVGTIISVRKATLFDDGSAIYLVHHPVVNKTYEYAEWHIKMNACTSSEYEQKYLNAGNK